MKVVESVLELIGNTPIAKLRKVTSGDVRVKLEYLNPSGSLKDRIALKMIEDAEKNGRLKRGYTIIDASTGNTGIALSFVGAMKGYKVIIYHPALGGVSKERVEMMKRYGAEVRLIDTSRTTSGEKSVNGAEIENPLREMCRQLERKDPTVWWARQFSNPANTAAHNTTGEEILAQTKGKADVFVAAIGTGGTLMGVSEALRRKLPKVKTVGVQPASSTGSIVPGTVFPRSEVSGGIISDMLEKGLVDEVVKVSDEEAINMAHRLWREEGLFCGISSGANVLVAKREAEYGLGKTVVTVLPDSGDRYLSEEHFVT